MNLKKNSTQISQVGGFGTSVTNPSKLVYLNGTTDYIDVISTGSAAQTRVQTDGKSFFQAIKIK